MTGRYAGKTRLLALLCLIASGHIAPMAKGQTGPLPPPIAAERSPQQLAIEILQAAVHEAVWGTPAFCSVRQQVRAFGHQVSGFGKFIRAGQGSGKLKLTIQFPAGDTMNTLLQISDGQRLHTIEDIDGMRKRTIIDLDKVRKRLVINDRSIHDPTIAMYLAIGGQAESLRKLAQQYEWYDVRLTTHEGKSAWLLTGRLADQLQPTQIHAGTDGLLHVPKRSGLLPTEARVVIGKAEADSELPHWLYRVEQTRAVDESSLTSYRNHVQLVTEWSQPARISENVDHIFSEPATSNDPLFEETDLYLPPASKVAQVPDRTNVE